MRTRRAQETKRPVVSACGWRTFLCGVRGHVAQIEVKARLRPPRRLSGQDARRVPERRMLGPFRVPPYVPEEARLLMRRGERNTMGDGAIGRARRAPARRGVRRRRVR